jgi:hypothetical protein
MSTRIPLIVAVGVLVGVGGAVLAARAGRVWQQTDADLTVHEWGTFTTVAGTDGQSIDWRPLGGPTDLPCFVDYYQNREFKVILGGTVDPALDYASAPGRVVGRVRMETPVLYFYASRPTEASVRVDFRRGLMTEWFPSASVTQPAVAEHALANPNLWSTIAWPTVQIEPGASASFPAGAGPSHYYAARATDAAPVRVGDQREKFLFYRGVAGFDAPISAAVLDDGTVRLKDLAADPIPNVVLFQNDGGRIAYRVLGPLGGTATVELPAPAGTLDALRADLVRLLVADGLFPREAQAMVETWRDSWFEEGTRLFYLVPPSTVNEDLPLTVNPAPARVGRVFVGRVELITADTMARVARALAAGDDAYLRKVARFLGPIGNRLGPALTLVNQERLAASERAALASYLDRAAGCQ